MMNDLISRQAVLALPRNRIRNMRGKIVEETIDVTYIEQLPSVQPEPRNKNNEEVISILSDMRSRYNCFDPEDEEYYRGLSEAIKALSAQPEIVRCKDCKYSDENWRRVSVRWLPCMDMRTGSNWFCGSAERRTDDEG